MKELGYGKGYAYDHDAPERFSGQGYFPDGMERQRYYEPTGEGFEGELRRRMAGSTGCGRRGTAMSQVSHVTVRAGRGRLAARPLGQGALPDPGGSSSCRSCAAPGSSASTASAIEADARLAPGQVVRVPPLGDLPTPHRPRAARRARSGPRTRPSSAASSSTRTTG